MICFTSDLHFGHAKILEYCDRGYSDIDKMNEGLIQSINACVSPEDTLYILGDIALHSLDIKQAEEYISRINCRKVLINGNHDRKYDESLFEGVYDYLEIRYKNKLLVLFHYPIEKWKNCEYGSMHLHGHLHSPPSYNEKQKSNGILKFDVGVDANNCKPISIDKIFKFFEV